MYVHQRHRFSREEVCRKKQSPGMYRHILISLLSSGFSSTFFHFFSHFPFYAVVRSRNNEEERRQKRRKEKKRKRTCEKHEDDEIKDDTKCQREEKIERQTFPSSFCSLSLSLFVSPFHSFAFLPSFILSSVSFFCEAILHAGACLFILNGAPICLSLYFGSLSKDFKC